MAAAFFPFLLQKYRVFLPRQWRQHACLHQKRCLVSLAEAVKGGIPAKVNVNNLVNKWLQDEKKWTPSWLEERMPNQIEIKRDCTDKWFMYAEENHPHLLEDVTNYKTEFVQVSPTELFNLCDKQAMRGKCIHYYTSPLSALGPSIANAPGPWQEHMLVDPALAAQVNAHHFLSVWIGGAGSSTSAHYDVLSNVFVQVCKFGRAPDMVFTQLIF